MSTTTAQRNGRLGALRRLASRLGGLAMAVVMVACLSWLAPSVLGYERYVITGGSMSGTYDKGSVVFEKATPAGELAVGDVITYLPPSGSGVHHLVTHRIVSAKPGPAGTVFTTKGDANPDPDPWTFQLTSGSQPVATFAVPMVGYAFIAMADRTTRMFVIGGPAALVALMSLVELVRVMRRPSGSGSDHTTADPGQQATEVALPAAV